MEEENLARLFAKRNFQKEISYVNKIRIKWKLLMFTMCIYTFIYILNSH